MCSPLCNDVDTIQTSTVVHTTIHSPQLGTAAKFAILAGSTVANAGLNTLVTGDIGNSPGVACTGFSNQSLIGTTSLGLAKTDLDVAVHQAAEAPQSLSLTGVDLGGLTLQPGVYTFASTASIAAPNGQLTLSGSGVFIFQIGSALGTSLNSQVLLVNGALPQCVFWLIGSSAVLGSGCKFQGILMASASIGFMDGASLVGAAYAQNAAVTLTNNVITVQPACNL
ncbi:unnamed protein product [Didymodactylos carnosus]|uniref:Ice-binding protein n=1 Tax=Didymodactylos carnosus TaxID=1234261 RepID=A0A815YUP7_9BILA|nr:unnamed protein product [Didymodactylos carnosus]CAF4438847.1 unnamed protein product [Didymodactylos carnosus]